MTTILSISALRRRGIRRGVLAFAVLLAAASSQPAAGQLRVVNYNTGGDSRPGMGTILQAIGAESANGIARPVDILVLEEQDSSATTTQKIVDVLNGIYGAGAYTRATLDGATTGAGRPGLIYRTGSVDLIGQTAVGSVSDSGAARQTLRYQLRPDGYGAAADFFVYASHYKASSGSANESRRQAEAIAVRANADKLGAAHIIYAGDLNIYSSSEPMYQTLLATGAGQAFDPINRPGNWDNASAFRDIHTQSPATTQQYGGQITGGVDDRFDFQLVTSEFLDGEGLSHVAGSYRAFGNTGTHSLNGAITSGSTGAFQARLPGYSAADVAGVLSAIGTTSDHLPVVADFQVPAVLAASLKASAPRVIVGAMASASLGVRNAAAVVSSNGADELDYAYSASGDLAGGGSGIALALDPAKQHALTLDTGTVGHKTGAALVTTTSQGAANPSVNESVSIDVLAHARPSFDLSNEITFHLLDLGAVAAGSGTTTRSFTIANLGFDAALTARLDLDVINVTGDAGQVFTNIMPFQNLGGAAEFFATISASAPGNFETAYTLHFSDENLPGATAAGDLTLIVRAAVVPEPGIMAYLILTVLLGAASRLAGRDRFLNRSQPCTSQGTGRVTLENRSCSQN